MSLNDTLDDLETDELVVTRKLATAPVNGIFPEGATTTFTISCVIQPATGMQRVVGGRDMRATEFEGQYVDDVRQLYTTTKLETRTPTLEPDTIAYEGSTWTVFRVERWELSGEIHYQVVITRQTAGAS